MLKRSACSRLLFWVARGVAVLALGGCAGETPTAPASPPAAVRSQPAAKSSHWTIGVYTGPSLFRLAPPEAIRNPVLTAADVTDMDVDIVAYPFIMVQDSRYYLFFKVMNKKANQCAIGLAESGDGLRWTYRRIVLREPFDLSYPSVFRWHDEYYMVPETHTLTSLRLYRAVHFPDQWAYEGDLLSGDHYINPSIVQHQGSWWMFTGRSGNETSRLFYAPDLKGPWTEHPKSPIVEKDLHTARPGGRPVVIEGTLYRLAQDCAPTYGHQVRAFQVTEITKTTYRETLVETPIIQKTSRGWNAEAMHHVDLHRVAENHWIAAVDALGP
jgi:hypothetical protein